MQQRTAAHPSLARRWMRDALQRVQSESRLQSVPKNSVMMTLVRSP